MNTPEMNDPSGELDRLFSGLPADLSMDEQKFAEDLMRQAKSNPPEARFVEELSNRLQLRHPNRKPSMFKLRNFWLAFAGGAAVIISLLFGLPFLRQPVLPVAVSNLTSSAVTSQVAMVPSVAPTELPFLPLLGPSSVQASANLSEQIPNAQWTLQTNLPTEPKSAIVYRSVNGPAVNLENIRKLADKFGLKGHIYSRGSGQPGYISYMVIDGLSELDVYGLNMSFTYWPDVTHKDDEHTPSLPFQQRADAAVAFMKARGLLDYDYSVDPGKLTTDEVYISQRMDGKYPLVYTEPTNPEYVINVAGDGTILAIRGQALNLKEAGKYPIRSASDAWKDLINGNIGGRFGYQVANYYPPITSLNWAVRYAAGQKVDTVGLPQSIPSADGGQAIVMMDNLILEGSLPQIAADNEQLMHVTGTMKSENVLSIETTEPSNIAPENTGFIGTLAVSGQSASITTMDGRTLPIDNPPAGLPDKEPASVSGLLRTDGSIQWNTIYAGPAMCASFSSGFTYSDAGSGGGGGGGGGGGNGEGDMCIKYPNLHGNVTTGGFDNLQTGDSLVNPAQINTPYKNGDKVDGLVVEVIGNMLVKSNGTRIPRFFGNIYDENGEVKWSADLLGDKLGGLESQLHMMVRLWGTYQQAYNKSIIVVDRYERVDPSEKIGVWQGSVEARSVNGKNAFVLTALDGTKYIMKTSLNFPPQAFENTEQFAGSLNTIEGVLLPDKIGGYPVIRDVMSMNGRPEGDTQPQSTQMMEYGPDESVLDLISGQVNITSARLVYLMMDFASGHLPEDHPARTIQPLWEFSGTLQDGRIISLFVQAVDGKYLK
jgi:hypothetical protein